MFPRDTKTATLEIEKDTGATCGTILPASTEKRTILQGSIITIGGDEGTIKYGSNLYLHNRATQGQVNLNTPIYTNEAITCTRVNNKAFSFYVTYLDYDLSTTPSGEPIIPYTDPTLSAGDMLISFLLLIGLVLAVIAMIQKAIFGMPVRKKYHGRFTDGKEGAEIYHL